MDDFKIPKAGEQDVIFFECPDCGIKFRWIDICMKCKNCLAHCTCDDGRAA